MGSAFRLYRDAERNVEERGLVGHEGEPVQRLPDQPTPGRNIVEPLGGMAFAPPAVRFRKNDVENLPGWLIRSGVSFNDVAS